jgi:hypothetical protein
MTFVHGFPVSGLSESADADRLLITTVNNERMVASEGSLGQSWMILPYVPSERLAGERHRRRRSFSRAGQRSGPLQARLDEVRKVWTPWFAPVRPSTFC